MPLLTETLITTSEVAERHGIGEPTVRRWMKNGVRGVRLESVMIGGARKTSVEALRRFFEKTQPA